jgi:hypothetical protein
MKKGIMTERQFLSVWGKYMQTQGCWYYRIPDANKWDAGKIQCPVCKNDINPDKRIRFTPSRPGDCLVRRGNTLVLIEAKRIIGKSINFSKAFSEHQQEALSRTQGHVLLFIDTNTNIGTCDFSAYCVEAGLVYQNKICFAMEFKWHDFFCKQTIKLSDFIIKGYLRKKYTYSAPVVKSRSPVLDMNLTCFFDYDIIGYKFKNKSKGFTESFTFV